MVADGPVAWDLRNANSNLVALGLVVAAYALAARRPAIAGVLIGLSISLKLYSGLLLLWLLANGPRPALYAGALTCIFLWLLLPAAVFVRTRRVVRGIDRLLALPRRHEVPSGS